uniref:Type I phosphodiesterase/nucleotide pyrophosphatase n=1 Tax=Solibacter usitatus (strain Ellin6076) TaxID=234267 RepID=Q01YP9_SOLUE
MKQFLLCVLLAATLSAATPKKPKLVLVVVVDQCRYDYLTRYRTDFKGGFDRLLKNGASFTSAHDDFFPSLTAVAHAVLLTGAMPSATGIIGNTWFNRETGKSTSAVSDDSVKVVGAGGGASASPHLLLAPTVGDELKAATGGRALVIGISQKDRSAILPAGAKANAAFWFDESTGTFVTSTYYMQALPEWVQAYNNTHPADEFLGTTWQGHLIPRDSKPKYKSIPLGPFGNRLTEGIAERALEAEQLGKHDDPDLLSVSLSATDYVGHDYGPDSPEEKEALMETDRDLDHLLQAVDRQVGLANTLVVLTSDHGVAPRNNGGQLPLKVIGETVQSALKAKYGDGKWVSGNWDPLVFLNHELIAEKKLSLAEVNATAADALRKLTHIARVYTREQLADPKTKLDETGRLFKNGFNPERAADLVFIPEPNWIFFDGNYTHSTTYDYDTHVPLIFMGTGIRAGSYKTAARSNDISATLAEILGIPKPSASVGRVLEEMFAK